MSKILAMYKDRDDKPRAWAIGLTSVEPHAVVIDRAGKELGAYLRSQGDAMGNQHDYTLEVVTVE